MPVAATATQNGAAAGKVTGCSSGHAMAKTKVDVRTWTHANAQAACRRACRSSNTTWSPQKKAESNARPSPRFSGAADAPVNSAVPTMLKSAAGQKCRRIGTPYISRFKPMAKRTNRPEISPELLAVV